MPESHSSQEKSDNALRDECQGCHSGHVEPDCPAHGVDSEQARINYMSPEERDAEYRRKFGSDECEACGGRHDNCGKPDYCCAGCDKIPRSTVATFPVLCTEDCQREKDALRQLLEAHVLEEKRIRKGIARAHCATCTKPYDRCSLCQLAGRYATEES